LELDNVLLFAVAGFFAQMVDGSLGMGYKVSASAFLLGTPIPQTLISATVHMASAVVGGVSGYSHWRYGNVDRDLLWRLTGAGVVGGIIGALLLSSIPSDALRPIVAVYLLILGVRLVTRRRAGIRSLKKPRGIAFVGGFMDAVGGGGWGPLVTGSLLNTDIEPRYAIGTANLAEFFVSVAQVVTFILSAKAINLSIALGLIVGGAIAAPIAARFTGRVRGDVLAVLAGGIIIILNLRTLLLLVLN